MVAVLKSRSALSRTVDIFRLGVRWIQRGIDVLVEFPCGCQTVGVDASRLERSGGKGTTIVSMSGSDDSSKSLGEVLLMLAFVGVWIGVSCMVMGGWVFMGVEPFSHRRRGVPIFVSTNGRGVMSWGGGGDFR